MLAASLLLKKIYSNAKASSSNELMLCLSALPSLVSWDLFLMLFQVSADSLCCGAQAAHRAWPGPRLAWQRTLGDGVLHALLIEEPGSQGNLEAVLHSSLLTQAVAQPGFPGVHGMGEGHGCTCSDAFSHHPWWYPLLSLEHAQLPVGAL